MKLDRNINADGGGKYALVLMRRFRELTAGGAAHADKHDLKVAFDLLVSVGVIDLCTVGTPAEFFPIRLRDKYAADALTAYANAAMKDDGEYAGEVYKMAQRAGLNSIWCKAPD